MQNLPLATGYTTCNHESTGESIQSIFEKYDHTSSPRDSCSAICFLLLVCCRWVGTADIHGMSDIIANLLLNHDRDISTIRYYMWLFYVELGNPGMHLFSHVGLTTTAENVICHAMVKRTGNELGVPSKFPFTVCVCVKRKLDPCGLRACRGWVYCAFHMQRLLAPEGIENTNAMVPECDHAILAHGENEPRPVASNFTNTKIPDEIWNANSSWTPPGPQGFQVLYQMGGMSQYLQLERLLLDRGMAILKQKMTDENTKSPLYMRISGYQFPKEIDVILDVIDAALHLISAERQERMDVWIDVASDVAHESLSNTNKPNMMRVHRVQQCIQDCSHICNVTILWNDCIRYQKIQTIDFWNRCIEFQIVRSIHKTTDIQYLDFTPVDMNINLFIILFQLANSMEQQGWRMGGGYPSLSHAGVKPLSVSGFRAY
jgi:hypothetical protein